MSTFPQSPYVNFLRDPTLQGDLSFNIDTTQVNYTLNRDLNLVNSKQVSAISSAGRTNYQEVKIKNAPKLKIGI